MKANRKALYIFAVIISIASFFAWMENRSYQPEEKKYSIPDEAETIKKEVALPVQAEKKIPHFVAGRTALVEQAKKIYEDKKDPNEKGMSLGSKLVSEPISRDQSIHLSSVNVSFMNNLFACAQSECQKSDAVITTSGFYIYKGDAPKSIDSRSKALVTYDREINQYGIWEGRVIIETHTPVDLTTRLSSMKFKTIERPQDKLFIANYTGSVSNLDSVLSEVKSIPTVSKVRLEITYSRNRGN